MGLFSRTKKKEIVSARLLGMRTAEQTMFFSTTNFSVYSFYVEYNDGTTATIEVSPQNPSDKSKREKVLFDKLMAYETMNSEKTQQNSVSREETSEIINDLAKLKDLFDANVIPEDVYETKRQTLLSQLNKKEHDIPNTKNVKIVRMNQRSWGESKISIFIDGKKIPADLDGVISLSLSLGCHLIYCQRSACRSSITSFTVNSSKTCVIKILPKSFSFDISVSET